MSFIHKKSENEIGKRLKTFHSYIFMKESLQNFQKFCPKFPVICRPVWLLEVEISRQRRGQNLIIYLRTLSGHFMEIELCNPLWYDNVK